MGLSEAQEGALNILFRIADEEGLLVLDLKDLRALLADIATRGGNITTQYGNVSDQTIGAIQRRLVVIEEQGGTHFFGEPAFKIADLMRTTRDGRGYVSVLAADKLMESPQLYATFLLWLMSELFEELPEVGDPEKPKLVFFFDEAHLLFNDAPPGLLNKIEQVVRLIRSKGVGIYFVTQNPLDVPDTVLSQLGNRIQHALRAFTPRDQKAVKAAAQTFRQNPAFDTEKAITELGVGEALVSVLDEKGVPTMVERTLIRPPSGKLGPIDPATRQSLIRNSPIYGEYDKPIDRESAYEVLAKRSAERQAAAKIEAQQQGRRGRSQTPGQGLELVTHPRDGHRPLCQERRQFGRSSGGFGACSPAWYRPCSRCSGRSSAALAPSDIQLYRLLDLDAETRQAHIMAGAGGQETDRIEVEIAQDLRPQPDVAPGLHPRLGRAGRHIVRIFEQARGGNARGALAQIDEDAAAFFFKGLVDGVEGAPLAEDIVGQVLAVQAHRHALPIADLTENQRQMLHRIEGRRIGDAPRRADGGGDIEGAGALHQPLARLPVGDEGIDRDDPEIMLAGEFQHVLAALHRAVVVDQLGNDAHRWQACQAGEIDGRLGVAGAHEHPAALGHQRKDMAGPHEIAGRRHWRWRARARWRCVPWPRCRW